MAISRRALLGNLAVAEAFAAQGSKVWAGEIRKIVLVQGVGVPQGIVQILYNENPLGPSPLAIKAATEVISSSNRYPMMATLNLVRQLHQSYGLAFDAPTDATNVGALFAALGASPIILGVGSTEILRATALAYGLEGGEFIEAVPGYAEIGQGAADMLAGRVKRVMVPLREDYHLDTAAMLKAVTPQTRLMVVTNPNNPTGTALSAQEITQLADRLDPKVLLVIDEAYIDFAVDPAVTSMIELAKTRSNVLVTRTFSKIHGLAGLRLGYGLGSKQVIKKIHPYVMNLIGNNSPALAAATAALTDQQHQRRSYQMTLAAREQLMSKLPGYGFTPIPSQANFVWVKVNKDCSSLVKKLAQQRVLIAGGQRWQLPEYIRISVGLPTEMEALFAALDRSV